MSTRYHYNKDGDYRGCTSDVPPASSSDALGYIVVGVLVVATLHAVAPYLLVGGMVWVGYKVWAALSE